MDEDEFRLFFPVFGLAPMTKTEAEWEVDPKIATIIPIKQGERKMRAIALFTDRDLALAYCSKFIRSNTSTLEMATPEVLLSYLENVDTQGVDRIAFDFGEKGVRPDWIFRLPEFMDLLRAHS